MLKRFINDFQNSNDEREICSGSSIDEKDWHQETVSSTPSTQNHDDNDSPEEESTNDSLENHLEKSREDSPNTICDEKSIFNTTAVKRSNSEAIRPSCCPIAKRKPLSSLNVSETLNSFLDENIFEDIRKNAEISNTVGLNTLSPWKKIKNTFTQLRKIKSNLEDLNNEQEEQQELNEINDDSNESEETINSTLPPELEISDTPTTNASQSLPTPPTELDLFLALVQSETTLPNTTTTTTFNSQRYNYRKSNLKNIKKCRPDGYLEKLKKAIDIERIESKHLQSGLKTQTGIVLSILEIKESFGVYLATVVNNDDKSAMENNTKSDNMCCKKSQQETEDMNTGPTPTSTTKQFYVILSAEMAKTAKVGSKLLAYFDIDGDNCDCYWQYNTTNDEKFVQPMKIFMQPNKLILL